MTRIAAPATRPAKIAGLLYVVVAICAALTYDYVIPRVYLPRDAATTAHTPRGARD